MSQITLTVLKNPFNTAGREIHTIDYLPGKTIHQYVQPYTMGLDDFIYSANGVQVEAVYVPEPGEYIAVCPVVGKSKWLGSLLSLGLAVWTGSLAQNGFWGMSGGKFAAGLAAGAIAYAGGQLINHFFPPPTAEISGSSSAPTYGWGPITAQVAQGGVLARTYGTMKTAGTELARHITVDGDKQYLNILYTGGQGPLDEITDIEINGNPIENFTGVQVDVRLGTNDQEAIPNFGDTYANQPLSYELKEDGWSTHVTEGNAGQGLEIMVECPNGIYHMSDNGGLETASVTLASEYRKDDGEWIPWLGTSYIASSGIAGATCYPTAPPATWRIRVFEFKRKEDGDWRSYGLRFQVSDQPIKTTDPYRTLGTLDNGKIKCVIPSQIGTYTIIVVNDAQISAAQNTAIRRTFQLENLPTGKYEVRLKVHSRSAPPTSTRDSTRVYWVQMSSKIYVDLCRPNKSLIGIRALATDQLNGNDITVTWKQHKNTVLIWNPDAQAYEPKEARNPAWAAYDMVHGAEKVLNINTGQYEFIVDNVPANRIDYRAFADWAARMDSLGVEFEHIFDTAADLWTALKIPETFGRGKVIMQGTRFSCICDKPSTPVQLFTVGNINQSTFEKEFLGLTDRANAIEITFVNRDKGYERDCFTVYGDDYNEEDMLLNPTQITLNGCTSYQQAYQFGKYLLRINKYLLRTVTWEADIDAIACQIGDQVLLQHDVPEYGAGGNLQSATTTILTLDRQITMESGKSYGVYVRMPNDALISKYVVNRPGETNRITVTTPYATAPPAYAVWAFGEISKEAKPFFLIDVDRKDDLTCSLTGIEYVAAIYEESLDAPVIDYSTADMTLPEVSNLSVAQETYHQKDGTVISVVHCSWALPRKPVNSTVIFYQPESSTAWIKWDSQQEPNAAITGVKAQETYRVKVCTVSSIGVISDGVVSQPIYITGKDQPPTNIASLMATINLSDTTKITLTWPAITDIDLRGYQLMEGSTVLTPTPITDTQYIYTATQSRSHTFSVRAVDNSGNLSETPAIKTISVTIEPAQVAGFAIAIQETDRSKALITWQANTETDIAYYEIRQGNTGWNTATIIATQLKATAYQHQITAEGNQTFLIKAVNAAGKYSLAETTKTLQIILRPNPPTDITALQDAKDKSTVKLSWTASPGKDIAGYQLRYGATWATGQEIDSTRELSYRWQVPDSGTYNLMICAQTVAGYISNVASIPVTVTTEPSNVTEFSATQSDTDKRIIKFTWQGIPDPDFSYYEIREGTNWNTAAVVATKIGSTYYNYAATAEKTATYLIKAANKSEKYSNDPDSTIVAISLTPSRPSSGSVLSDYANRLKLLLSWDKVSDLDIDYYEVKYGTTVIATTKETSTAYTVPTGGAYTFTVRAKNLAGFYSSTLTLTGNVAAEPTDITTFTVSQRSLDRTVLDFAWSASTDTDFTHYEIRKGTNWNTAAVVATQLKTTTHSAPATAGAATYMIKAVNAAGYGSVNAKTATITITLTPAQPATGTITQDPKDKTSLIISWATVADADLLQYEVRKGTNWATGTKNFEGKEASCRYPISANGTYAFMVCSKNVGGYYSPVLNLSIAATINPGDITDFTATQSMTNRSIVTLHWEPPADMDISHFEIRQGIAWDTATVIGNRLTGKNLEIQVLDETSHFYFIKAVSIAGYYSQNAAAVEGIFNLNPAPVTNIQISQNPNERSQLVITWQGIAESDLTYYDVRLGYEWDTATKIAETKETRWLHQISSTGDIKILIKAKNAAGFFSDEAAEHYYATVEPGPVTGFVALQNGEYVELFWNKHAEPDVVSYEISEGASFDMGQLVVSGITTTEHKVKVDTERNYYYHIKAINRALKYSAGAASAGVYVGNLPIKNIIKEYDEIALQTGTADNTEFGPSLINWSNMGGKFSDYPTTKFSDVGGQTVLKLARKTNLATNGYLAFASSGYLIKTLTLSENIITGQVYTITLSGTKEAAQKFGIWQNAGSTLRGYFTQDAATGLHKVTFTAIATTAGNERRFDLYNYPSTGSLSASIEWIKVEKGGVFTGIYLAAGAYQSTTKDMNQIITANITCDFRSTVVLRGLGSAVLQIRTSKDGTNWTAWQDFKPAQYTFRYLEARVLLATENQTNTPEVNHLTLRIDVPDTDMTGSVTIPIGGATIGYGHNYYEVPVLTPMALGDNRFPVILAKTKTEFTAKITDRAGTDTGGTLDWRAKGY